MALPNHGKAPYLTRYDDAQGPIGWIHWCPGCRCGHAINVERPTERGHRWTFNGDHDHPTFSPSVHIKGHSYKQGVEIPGTEHTRCHYFLKDAQIQFLPDCQHELAGQTVPLPRTDD